MQVLLHIGLGAALVFGAIALILIPLFFWAAIQADDMRWYWRLLCIAPGACILLYFAGGGTVNL